VPGYFLDTSAFAKLYHQELGSDVVERIVAGPNPPVISRLSIIEIESAFSIKVRTGQLDVAGRDLARRRIRADISQGRVLVGPPIEERQFQRACQLIELHGAGIGLRTLDAVQLAVALDLLRSGAISVMVAADQRLCQVAELAGCPAIDPSNPGVVKP
jgi:predicted nucleic acid-binding protein